MLLFIIKIYRTARRAIAGRAHPGQLAWAVGLGVLLGVIPHGNLVAVALCLLCLCANVNHAAMGLVAVGVTMFAGRLDPITHRVGDLVLSRPEAAAAMVDFWRLPLAAWTDLNHTIVVGSLVVGLAAVLPVTLIAYPLCRLIAPRKRDVTPERQHGRRPEPSEPAGSDRPGSDRLGNLAAEPPHPVVPAPHFREIRPAAAAATVPSGGSESTAAAAPAVTPTHARVDVIRAADQFDSPAEPTPSPADDPAVMDEALTYLLRQLRETAKEDAA